MSQKRQICGLSVPFLNSFYIGPSQFSIDKSQGSIEHLFHESAHKNPHIQEERVSIIVNPGEGGEP